MLSALKHPNIIRLLEAHFLGGVFYFVMEYAEGGPLVRHIYARWASMCRRPGGGEGGTSTERVVAATA